MSQFRSRLLTLSSAVFLGSACSEGEQVDRKNTSVSSVSSSGGAASSENMNSTATSLEDAVAQGNSEQVKKGLSMMANLPTGEGVDGAQEVGEVDVFEKDVAAHSQADSEFAVVRGSRLFSVNNGLCEVFIKSDCPRDPSLPTAEFFKDNWGMKHARATTSAYACHKRAYDYKKWCKMKQGYVVTRYSDPASSRKSVHLSPTNRDCYYKLPASIRPELLRRDAWIEITHEGLLDEKTCLSRAAALKKWVERTPRAHGWFEYDGSGELRITSVFLQNGQRTERSANEKRPQVNLTWSDANSRLQNLELSSVGAGKKVKASLAELAKDVDNEVDKISDSLNSLVSKCDRETVSPLTLIPLASSLKDFYNRLKGQASQIKQNVMSLDQDGKDSLLQLQKKVESSFNNPLSTAEGRDFFDNLDKVSGKLDSRYGNLKVMLSEVYRDFKLRAANLSEQLEASKSRCGFQH